MLSHIQNTWNNHGFEILVVSCILVILILSLFNRNNKGTWSTSYIFNVKSTIPSSFPKKISKGETECRRVLRKIFNKPFNTQRPDFLRNPITSSPKDNFNLELDCYEPSLKLACEYQGVQHYKYVPYFHKNKEAFRNQAYRDELKRRMCKDSGIRLIEVPYTIKLPDIENFIRQKLL